MQDQVLPVRPQGSCGMQETFPRTICTTQHVYHFFFLGASSPLCWFYNKEFLCITHRVEHNYISPSSSVGIQIHVSALYVDHLQVVI